MLRYHIGETNFKMRLKKYLEKYQYKNVKTSNFIKVLEEVSGENLQPFFKQWVYSSGHPELEISLLTLKTNSIKIIQTQDILFNFNLDVKISSPNLIFQKYILITSKKEKSHPYSSFGERICKIED